MKLDQLPPPFQNVQGQTIPVVVTLCVICASIIAAFLLIEVPYRLGVRRFRRCLERVFPELSENDCAEIANENRESLRKIPFFFTPKRNSPNCVIAAATAVTTLRKPVVEAVPDYALNGGERLCSLPEKTLGIGQPSSKLAAAEEKVIRAFAAGLRESFEGRANKVLSTGSNALAPRLRRVWQEWMNVQVLPRSVEQAFNQELSS